MMDQINSAIKEAMKAKESEKLQALRFFKSKLIENKTAKKPQAEMDVLISHVKKLKDSAEVYPDGSEERAKIIREASFLDPYMPKQLTEGEVVAMIEELVAGGATQMSDFMRGLMPKIKGKFDGKRANQLVSEALKKD